MNQICETEAVVAGHICLDITPNFNESKKTIEEILSPGKLTKVSGVKLSTGGAVSNTGIALSMLGVNTKLMGKVGADYFGDDVLKILKETNVHEGMVVVEGAQTSYTIILVPGGADRIFLHDSGANDTFCAEDINYDIVCQVKLFHFGYPPVMKRMYENSGEELIKMFKKVKSLGVTTSLDMCLVDPESDSGRVDWEGILKSLLPYVDIFLPSIEEILFMIDKDNYIQMNEASKGQDILDNLDLNVIQGLGEKLSNYGAKIVVIKCGKKGYYIRTAGKKALVSMGKAAPDNIDNWVGRELFEETFYVSNVLSTTGAGDTSIAGFLAGFLNNMNIEEAIKVACGTGAECVQTYDALSGIKTVDKTLEMINGGWKKNKITIDGGYWTYDEGRSVWVGNKDLIFNK